MTIRRSDVSIAALDFGGVGPAVILLHGLAGSSQEMQPTAAALSNEFRVILIDQRGHGRSTRRPADLARKAFVGDVASVITHLLPGQQVVLVGQSMGAHTAFLTAAAHPDLVDALVMLEGHPEGKSQPRTAQEIGEYFASWPSPFADTDAARSFLGDTPLAAALIEDLESTPLGLRPRFDPDIMQTTIAAVHPPRWQEWESLPTPTLAVFAENGLFSDEDKAELIRRRPGTLRADIPGAGHDAHLDAFDLWIEILLKYLRETTTGDFRRQMGPVARTQSFSPETIAPTKLT
ncbi:MAG: alpha/beta hydrolase [Actinomycetota bacterium]|nr:alpha/beta hydrolase [Actinomycetota bacterium]